MKNRYKSLLISLFLLLLASCQSNVEETSSKPSISSPGVSSTSTSESVSSSKEEDIALDVSAYVSDVSATAGVMISGKEEGEDVDYVVSSYPVIYSAMQKNPKLKVVRNIASDFSKKYKTHGFPQAGLFIKTSLEKDETQKDRIASFLNTFDKDVEDLINGGNKAVSNMDSYSSDSATQTSRFGFTSSVIKNVQEDNSLAFISKEDNPTLEEFSSFSEPLSFFVEESQLSSYYSSDVSYAVEATSLTYSVVTPKGAPSACFTRYAGDTDKLTIASPTQVSANFASQDADFIIFDSVNGLKLSKKNKDSYHLLRMVTYGNLYLVSTGNDRDDTPSQDDYIVSYGEGLLPDLVFKATYQSEGK